MWVITFATQKGGSGKSTLCCSTAVCAQQSGNSIYILEMDRQGTTSEWREAREHAWPPVDLAEGAELGAGLTAIKREGFDLAMIDTPGANNPGVRPAILAADLIVIPVRPTMIDVSGCLPTAQVAIQLKRQFFFVISQVTGRTDSAQIRDVRAKLSTVGDVMEGVVALRKDHPQAMTEGLGVTEYAKSSKAAAEISQLWEEICARLERINTKGARDVA